MTGPTLAAPAARRPEAFFGANRRSKTGGNPVLAKRLGRLHPRAKLETSGPWENSLARRFDTGNSFFLASVLTAGLPAFPDFFGLA
jgi:hypothetical protein